MCTESSLRRLPHTAPTRLQPPSSLPALNLDHITALLLLTEPPTSHLEDKEQSDLLLGIGLTSFEILRSEGPDKHNTVIYQPFAGKGPRQRFLSRLRQTCHSPEDLGATDLITSLSFHMDGQVEMSQRASGTCSPSLQYSQSHLPTAPGPVGPECMSYSSLRRSHSPASEARDPVLPSHSAPSGTGKLSAT